MSSRSVLQGTFVTSVVCACGTSIHGILTLKPNTPLRALSAGINGGISGATFFSNPFLLSQFHRKRNANNPGDKNTEDLNWSEIRTDRLLDSGVSGLITGGILRGFTRNARGILPGAISAGVLCTLLQYMYNESKIIRLEYLVYKRQTSQQAPSGSTSSPVSQSSDAKPWAQRLLSTIGITSLSDEEYLASLKKQRDTHMKRITEIEHEMAHQEKTEEKN
ncbi:hypothetical protein D9757_003630 [Collybiopsis confluens]|uniref:Uncharacterized protein n=1 Tax=Collybiopsis confluens TaxID=2823264 RepID=A0A8H5HV56_9AGAR|nr:hypothetical protein D9757_003630 [Collybiopsis confluens]